MVAETADTELSVAEAAGFAGVSDRTIRNWINDGELEARNTPQGRKVRKDAVASLLREKGYAPPELETIVVQVPLTRPVAPQEPRSEPEPLPTPLLSPELINVVLQPLVEQLNQANARAEKKERENLELAGRIGYLQAKVQQYEERVLLLEPPKEPDLTSQAAMSDGEGQTLTSPPWWKRLFGLE